MNSRKFVFVAVAVSLVSLMGASRALAQGTVSWAAGFPVANNAPPGQPFGSVDVFGTYTVNPNWMVVDASVAVKPQAGGLLSAHALKWQNNQIGLFNAAGVLVPARISLLKNTWEATLFVRYRPNPNPNGLPDQVIASPTATFVIQ